MICALFDLNYSIASILSTANTYVVVNKFASG